ncbi:MAG: LUD domain-containing protein [bacterium]|nr:LUD domain-containing protein [bacterium]
MKNPESHREVVLKAIQNGLSSTRHTDHPQEFFMDLIPAPSPQRIGSDEVLHNFQKMLELVGGECYITAGEQSLHAALQEVLQTFAGSAVLLSPDPEIQRLNIDNLILQTSLRIIHPTQQNMEEAALAPVGLTSASAGIADTGTVVLVHIGETGRLSALLPEVHVVLLKKATIYPDKLTFLQQMKLARIDLGATPMTWVTGPSSTADIEKVLVRGAHGPRRLIALLY